MKVATAPTVYGIETVKNIESIQAGMIPLQQHLPFTVLKLLHSIRNLISPSIHVATAPTVYGIETTSNLVTALVKPRVATAPTVYGIETLI